MMVEKGYRIIYWRDKLVGKVIRILLLIRQSRRSLFHVHCRPFCSLLQKTVIVVIVVRLFGEKLLPFRLIGERKICLMELWLAVI